MPQNIKKNEGESMTWKDRMRVSVSGAEIEILKELQRRGLTRLLETQKPFDFIWQIEGVHGCICDFFYNHPFNYAIFIDGERVHSGRIREERDELIVKALERRGIHVDRFRYKTPISKRRIKEIADKIEETLRGMGYFSHVRP